MNAIIMLATGNVMYCHIPPHFPFRQFFGLFGDWHLAVILVGGEWVPLKNKVSR